jgi:hypothetical protein
VILIVVKFAVRPESVQQSAHFATAMAALPGAISAKPKIINVSAPTDGWSEMAELEPR